MTTVKARLGWKGLKAEEYQESGYYFLSTPNLKGHRIDFEGANYISHWRYEESPEIQLRIGDVLLVKDGSTLGIANLVRSLPGPATLNGSIALVRCNDRLEPLYLLQCVRGAAFQNLIRLKKAGLGVPHLFQADLRHFQIDLPPLPEQRQIATILDTIDDAIRRTEQIIAKLKQVKQGLLHDLLTRGIDDNGELRDPERHPEQFKDSPLGRIPKAWEVLRLGTVVPRATYGISESLDGGPGIPVLRMMNFKDGEADLSDLKFSRSKGARELLLQPGDVLFNRTNSIDHVGRTGIWRGQIEVASFASYLVRLEPDSERLRAEFLNRWLNWEATQVRIRRFATPGVHQVNINPTNLRGTLVALPRSLAEQDRAAASMTALDARLAREQAQVGKLRLAKQGLMEDLLTGRVRVTNLLQDAP